MVSVTFTANLQRHVTSPSSDVAGGTLREVLEAVFGANPQVRSYVLDDQGSLRRHMNVFVDGAAIVDRRGLTDMVADGAEVFVMQALSGG